MKDSKHKLLTLAALTTIAAGVVHVANRVKRNVGFFQPQLL